jgi:hypothetical protein
MPEITPIRGLDHKVHEAVLAEKKRLGEQHIYKSVGDIYNEIVGKKLKVKGYTK